MKIKHVYGNVLKLDIPLTIKIRTMEGDVPTEREEPFYPDESKGCVVVLNNNYNRKMEYNASLGGNVAHIEDDGVIGIGTYKVTVKCYDEYGNPYRYMVRDIIEICDATIDAGIEAGVEFNAETYTLEGAVFVSYGGGSFEQVQADWSEADIHSKAYIKNKPNLTQYATKEELSEVEGEIPTLPDHIVTDENYVHTDNNYTTIEKEKLAELENYDDSGIRQELDGKVDKVNGKGLSTNDFTDEDKFKLDSALQSETDPTVPSWAKQSQKPTYTAQEVGALPNSTKYGSTIDLTMNSTTYVLILSLKDQDGTVLNTKTVDLPIESVVVSGRYDATNKKIVLTLQSGSTIDVPVGDLIAGLQTEITSVNMLDADLVDDTNSTHKFVTTREKQAWNNKSDFSGSYNDLSDKPTIPTTLSQLSEDTTHRTVSDTEKTTWGNKQESLVSGTNIKTINNESILGGGNITIQGGGSAYVPTLNAAPTASTTTYTKDGQSVDFKIGQFCRVAKTGGGYVFYQLYDLQTVSNVTTATWEEVNNIQYNYEDVYITVGTIGTVPQGTIVAGLTINVCYNDAVTPTTTVITDSNGMASLQVPNGYKYKLVFPEQAGCSPVAAVEHTAMLLQRGVEVYYRALDTDIRTVWINPSDFSAQLVREGSRTMLENYVQRCKCYVFNADGTKMAEIKSATFEGNYSGMTAGTVTFADDTVAQVSALNAAGCNFMVLRPALHIWSGTEDGAEVLKCTGAYDLLPTGKKTFPKKYIGMFKAFNQSGKLKSQPGRIPTGQQTIATFQQQAKAGADGYGLWNYTDWCKENALHLAWFANTNYEDNVGVGIINNYDRVRNIVTGFTLPLAGKYQCGTKPTVDSQGNYVQRLNFFGIEGMGEQIWEFVIGFRHNGSGTAYIWDDNVWGESYPADRTFNLAVTSANQSYIKTVIAGQHFDMLPRATGASGNTGYCDGHWVNGNGRLLSVGGAANNGSFCGLSCSSANIDFSRSDAYIGARLAFYGEPEEVRGSELVASL